jgi:hypothetical protein
VRYSVTAIRNLTSKHFQDVYLVIKLCFHSELPTSMITSGILADIFGIWASLAKWTSRGHLTKSEPVSFSLEKLGLRTQGCLDCLLKSWGATMYYSQETEREMKAEYSRDEQTHGLRHNGHTHTNWLLHFCHVYSLATILPETINLFLDSMDLFHFLAQINLFELKWIW